MLLLKSSLAQIASIVMSDQVQQFLNPTIRQSSYANIRPKRLQSVLEKLARYGSQCRDQPSRERWNRRQKEAESIGRLYPGENR